MTIRRGEAWGSSCEISEAPLVVHSDQSLAAQPQGSTVFMAAGNLAQTLGNPVVPKIGEHRQCVSIDALMCDVTLNNGTHSIIRSVSGVFIGQLIPLLHRNTRFVVASNTGMHNSRNYAPRAHPNDGVFDVVTFSPQLPLRVRLTARSRLTTGTHIPHPEIATKQLTTCQFERDTKSEKLVIDGRNIPHWSSISIVLQPDYWNVIV